MGILRALVGYVAAVIAATLIGSILATQMVLAELAGAGAQVPMAMRLQTTLTDIQGFAPTYAVVAGVGFAIAFLIAFGLKRLLPALAPIAYPLAGAAAIAVALLAMSVVYQGTTPIAGARGPVGFALQCLAGALGGAVFAWIVKRRNA
ncbi:MAG TPA: hypothetical protein VNH64_10575 [Parvularculaceae bacterium]|nr:hypothetical protein [Parvularculaceae bacterium]